MNCCWSVRGVSQRATADAEAATLDNVRERCRRSEVAWTLLAERAERSEVMRAAEAERKAAEKAEQG